MTFNITATTPKKMTFVQQPTAKIPANSPFSVAVELKDKYGNIATEDNASVASLTLSGSSKSAVLTDGTLTEDINGGIATFSDLSLITPGSYKINAAWMLRIIWKATSKGFKITA